MKKRTVLFIFYLIAFCGAYSQNVAAFPTCTGQTLSIGPDQVFCDGDSATLTVNTSFDRIVWSTGSSASSIKVKTAGTYIVHGLKAATVELITKGDFPDYTTTSFTSQYLDGATDPDQLDPNYYEIVNSADDANWDFSMVYDHTSGNNTSNMMVVNGYTGLNKKIWCQTVIVVPGKNYNLSAWAATMGKTGSASSNPAKLQFKINTVTVGSTLNLTTTPFNWTNFSSTWASGINTSAEICIYDNVILANGNDFALDDISFTTTDTCRVSDTVVVTVNPKPVVNLGSDISSCLPSVTLSVPNPQPSWTYLWSNTDVLSSTTVNGAGTYSVEVTTVNGCKANDAVVVSIGSGTKINLGKDTVLCPGGSVLLNAGAGYTNYTWTGAKTGSSQTLSADVDGVYYINASGGGCSSSDTILVGFYTKPNVNLGSDLTLCTGSSTVFSPGSFAFYEWNNASTAPTLTANTTGTYWVKVTDANGCEASDTVLFTLQNLVTLNLGPDQKVCPGVSTIFDGGAGYNSYTWTGAKSGGSQKITADVAGDYILNVSAGGGCTATDTINLSFFTAPNVDLGPDTAVCVGSTINLNAGNFTSYLWSTGETSPSVNKGAGSYSIKVTDANFCTDTDAIVVSSIAKPSVNLGGSTFSSCIGKTETLQNLSGIAGTYSWTAASSGTTSLGTSSSLPITQSDVYTLTLTNMSGCSASASINVTFKNSPVVDLLNGVDSAAICEDASLKLDAKINANGISYSWLPGKQQGSSITVKSTGDYKVFVSDGTCDNSDVVHVEVIDMPDLVLHDSLFAIPTTYCFAEEAGGVNISAAPAERGTFSYLWNNGSANQSINVVQEGTYSVTISSGTCAVKDSLKLIDYCESTLFIPSAFTPNGDGINERFSAEGLHVDDFQLLIFNRWGELIFTGNSLNDEWDGTYQGVKVEEDVYVWKLLYTEKNEKGMRRKNEMIGKVLVLR